MTEEAAEFKNEGGIDVTRTKKALITISKMRWLTDELGHRVLLLLIVRVSLLLSDTGHAERVLNVLPDACRPRKGVPKDD